MGSSSETGANGPSKKGPVKDWFTAWFEGANLPKKTAQNWWAGFLASTGHDKVTPGKVEPPLRDAFFAWLEAKEAEKATAAAEAEAKAKADAERAARAKRRDALADALRAVIDHDGEGAALDVVREVTGLSITARPQESVGAVTTA